MKHTPWFSLTNEQQVAAIARHTPPSNDFKVPVLIDEDGDAYVEIGAVRYGAPAPGTAICQAPKGS
jgi:hypothetical protein